MEPNCMRHQNPHKTNGIKWGTRRRLSCISFSVVLLAGCVTAGCRPEERRQAANQYFPTTPKTSWIYVGSLNDKDSLSITIVDTILVRGQWYSVFEEVRWSAEGRSRDTRVRCLASVEDEKIQILPCIREASGKVRVIADTASTLYDFNASVGQGWAIPRSALDDYFARSSSPIIVTLQSRGDSILLGSGGFKDCIWFRTEIGSREYLECFAPGVGLVARGFQKMYLFVDVRTSSR